MSEGILSSFRRLQLAILPLKHLSDVPPCVAFGRIVCLPLREVDLLAMKALQSFLKALGAVGFFGYQDFQNVGQGKRLVVELSCVVADREVELLA